MATQTQKEQGKGKGKEQTAAAALEKEQAAQLAEAHKMEQEQAEAKFRTEQAGRAAGIGKAILSEALGGMAAAYAVGLLCWEYVNAEVIRHTGGKPERFTDAVRQLQKDLAARMTCDSKPNISRYLGYVGLSKLWNVDKLLSVPRSFAQNALPLITRDDTAPGLEYVQETARGNEQAIAYSWVVGCEQSGPELLDKLAAGIGTCQAMTVQDFTTARGKLVKGGKGRRNQGGKNAGGKGKGGKGMPAAKAAAKLSQCLAAIKSYAALAAIPAATRLKGLAAAVATIRELRDAIKAAAEKAAAEKAAAKGKGKGGKGGKAAAAENDGKAAAESNGKAAAELVTAS